jgi:hypothetical protein
MNFRFYEFYADFSTFMGSDLVACGSLGPLETKSSCVLVRAGKEGVENVQESILLTKGHHSSFKKGLRVKLCQKGKIGFRFLRVKIEVVN